MMTAVILQNYLMPEPQEEVAQQVQAGDGVSQDANTDEKTKALDSDPNSEGVSGESLGDPPVEASVT